MPVTMVAYAERQDGEGRTAEIRLDTSQKRDWTVSRFQSRTDIAGKRSYPTLVMAQRAARVWVSEGVIL